MNRGYLIHLAHLIKHSLYDKRPFSGRGILLNLAEKIIGKPTEPMLLKTLQGFKMYIDPVKDNGVERSIFYTGTYEAGTLQVFKQILKQGDNFLDIGSNIGLMALYASKLIGKQGTVHAFEPEPDTFAILQKNCRMNNATNILLNQFALGATKAEGLIYANMDINRGASSLVRADDGIGKKVEIQTLENYLSIHPGIHFKLLKLDVEGYELEVLKGAVSLLQSSSAPILCIEYSMELRAFAEGDDLYDFITAVNEYQVYKLEGWKGVPGKLIQVKSKEELPNHDNIFCFLPSHLTGIDKKVFKQ